LQIAVQDIAARLTIGISAPVNVLAGACARIALISNALAVAAPAALDQAVVVVARCLATRRVLVRTCTVLTTGGIMDIVLVVHIAMVRLFFVKRHSCEL
jgi:uncharacterized membrane protein YbhN (UPF0104 family)